MKQRRIIAYIALLLIGVMLFSSCSDKTEETKKVFYTVTFNTQGGTPIEEKKVESGKLADAPADPEKEGYIFDGWTYDVGKTWDFTYMKVEKDITLTAVWLTPESVFTYERNEDGTATITGKKKSTLYSITFPRSIGGYTVSAIGERAFTNLTTEDGSITVVIPDTVKRIEAEAFYNSRNAKITIEGSLNYVGEMAFYNCAELKSVSLEEGIERISTEAFLGCTSLTSVVIPKSVKVIEENAFDDCISLKAVVLHSSIESIEDMAFCNAPLQMIYAYGTDAEVDELLDTKLLGQNDELLEAGVLIYSESEPEGSTLYDGFWYYDSNGKVRKW